MMNKMMKKMAVALFAGAMTIAATGAIVSANDGTEYQRTCPINITEVNEIRYVSAIDGLFVRSDASDKAPVIGSLAYGDTVKVTGHVESAYAGNLVKWVQISFDEEEAFVNSEFLTETQPVVAAYTYAPAAVENTYVPAVVNNTYEETAQEYLEMQQSDAIASVIDEALDSGLFTQAEIDKAVNTITYYYNLNCTTEEEKMGQSDAIANVLNEMQQVMINAGYGQYGQMAAPVTPVVNYNDYNAGTVVIPEIDTVVYPRIDHYLSGADNNSWCSLNTDGFYYNDKGERFTDLGNGTFADAAGNVMNMLQQ